MIKGQVTYVELVRKGVTLKVDIDDKLRPENIATWQDEEVTLTNGKSIVTGNLWKIHTTTDECVRLWVDIPRGDYPETIFTWKHEVIKIEKEKPNGYAETHSKESCAKKRKRTNAK